MAARKDRRRWHQTRPWPLLQRSPGNGYDPRLERLGSRIPLANSAPEPQSGELRKTPVRPRTHRPPPGPSVPARMPTPPSIEPSPRRCNGRLPLHLSHSAPKHPETHAWKFLLANFAAIFAVQCSTSLPKPTTDVEATSILPPEREDCTIAAWWG